MPSKHVRALRTLMVAVAVAYAIQLAPTVLGPRGVPEWRPHPVATQRDGEGHGDEVAGSLVVPLRLADGVEEAACQGPSGRRSRWASGPVAIAGIEYFDGFWCVLSVGATGSVGFDLGGQYSQIRVNVGLLDGFGTEGRVRFEVIDAQQVVLASAEVGFGESATLDARVVGVLRATLRASLSSPAASGPSPAAAFASVTVLR